MALDLGISGNIPAVEELMEKERKWHYDLYELAHRVLRDALPLDGICDMAYAFGEMPENSDTVFTTCAHLILEGYVPLLGISEQHGYGNPPHAYVWERILTHMGILDGCIVRIIAEVLDNPSTYSESISLVGAAQCNGWKKVFIIAEPFHQVRAFMTLVSEVIKVGANIAVYNATPDQSDWLGVVTHSNGRTCDTRAGMTAHELRRITRYYNDGKGNLLHPSQIIAYLNKRDG